MNQIERYYKIDQLLNERGALSFLPLMGEFEISRATLKPDLAYLRDRLNASIIHDRNAGGYRFDHGASRSVPAGTCRTCGLPSKKSTRC